MLSRRKFLRGISMTGAAVQVGLPPLAAMFNMNGTAYAAEAGKVAGIDKRFLIWWNGNGIPERYWIPRETGENFELTACLSPLGRVREYVHVLSGVDNVAARMNGQGNGHFSALCGIMSSLSSPTKSPSTPDTVPWATRRWAPLPFGAARASCALNSDCSKACGTAWMVMRPPRVGTGRDSYSPR